MQPDASETNGAARVRFVFGDTVLSFEANPDVTLGEIARVLDGLSPSRYGHPVIIDVTLRRDGGLGLGWRAPAKAEAARRKVIALFVRELDAMAGCERLPPASIDMIADTPPLPRQSFHWRPAWSGSQQPATGLRPPVEKFPATRAAPSHRPDRHDPASVI